MPWPGPAELKRSLPFAAGERPWGFHVILRKTSHAVRLILLLAQIRIRA